MNPVIEYLNTVLTLSSDVTMAILRYQWKVSAVSRALLLARWEPLTPFRASE